MDPCSIAIELQCLGLRPFEAQPGDRTLRRTRAGLGSGLDLVLEGRRKDVWINAPVTEPFAASSPWELIERDGRRLLHDTRTGGTAPVRIPEEPAWMDRPTSSGVPMGRVGVLQGTILGIYVGRRCAFWDGDAHLACRFCTTGLNVGTEEEATKTEDDVVETARAAKEESGVTLVHFNSGFQGERDIDDAPRWVRAIKERVGALVGIQMAPSRHFEKYDRLVELGVDHLSFCFEFWNPEWFARLLPGKQEVYGIEPFLDAMRHGADLLGPGRVSGEIIAGVEPIDDTLRAIDAIVAVGAFPTVCIFRPTKGSRMEDHPPPKVDDMRRVFRHVAEACREAGLPIGIAPNVESSLFVQPDDAIDLLPRHDPRTVAYRAKLAALRLAAKPILARSMRRRPATVA